MWRVVYMVRNKESALKLEELLNRDGILVKIRPISRNNLHTDGYYEILVTESEVEEAHSVIIEEGY